MNRYIKKVEALVAERELSKPKPKGKGLLAPKLAADKGKEESPNDIELVTNIVYALRQQRKQLNNEKTTKQS